MKSDKHISKVGGELTDKEFICDPCGSKFLKRSGLTRHLKTKKHKNKILEIEKGNDSEEIENIEQDNGNIKEINNIKEIEFIEEINKEIEIEFIEEINEIRQYKLENETKRFDSSNFENISSNKCRCIICNSIMTNNIRSKERHSRTIKHISNKLENKDLTEEMIENEYDYHCWKHNYHTNIFEHYNLHMDGKLHTMTSEDHKKYKSDLGYNAHKIGDELEEYFTEIYKKCNDIEDVKRIGQTSNLYDIKIKYKDEDFYRGIQVKSISINNEMGIRGNYEDNTLLIGANIERTFFAIIPYSIVKHLKKHAGLTYKEGTVYYEYCYIDKNKFEEDLFKLSKTSTIMENEDDTLSKNHKIESESLKRLEQKCRELNLIFEERKTNTTVVDCIINNKNIQCKATNTKRGNLWGYTFGKTYKGEKVPYDEKDNVDFFIFETEKNNFYIIPKQELIDQKYISTKTNKGKKGIDLPQKNYKEYRTSITHWALKYLNAFNLIDDKIGSNDNELHCLDKTLVEKKLEFKTVNKKIDTIEGKKILYKMCSSLKFQNKEKNTFTYQFHMTDSKNGKRSIIKKGDYDYFIFEITTDKFKGNYYIIPEKILIDKGTIKTKIKPGSSSLSILTPDSSNNWAIQYYNNFEQFKQ